jgi:[protein-PII] uridylyltransferase
MSNVLPLSAETHNFTQVAQNLQQERERLIAHFLKDQAPDFMARNAGLLDHYFIDSFEASMVGPRMGINRNPYAFIALGGYGRQEQCVHSDVDLLLLFKKKLPSQAEELIREIVYPLWDIGLEVGYATRSVNECLRLAEKDYDVLIPLLDARFICGMSPVYSELMEGLRKKILAKRSKKIVAWLVKRNQDRHDYFGDSTYRLEPNLKEGKGGLRDYHTMLWLARIAFNIRQPRDFEYMGFLSHEEFQGVSSALAFIWKVRNRLHVMSGRKCDQLHFENQIKMAHALHFKKTNGLQPVELFLGELHSQMDFMKQQYLMFLFEHGFTPKRRFKLRPQETAAAGLEVRDDMLAFASSRILLENPELLIIIFEESARLRIPLTAEAKRMIKEFGYLVDDHFRSLPSVLKRFEYILRQPAPRFNVLREMLDTGFLARYLPVVKAIQSRIQYDEYHLFPVDKHSLRTVQILKTFGDEQATDTDPLVRDLYKGLRHRKPLLWAAFLHDIGKGVPGGDHAVKGARIAAEILPAYGLGANDVATISFLIEEHLLLIKIATRRDIHDEETIITCARRINDVKRLQMLYLLTIADSMATGPKAWNEWTATLVRDLFLKVLNILEKGELAGQATVRALEAKKARVFELAAQAGVSDKMAALYDVLSPRYLLYAPEQEILANAELFWTLGDKPFVWQVSRSALRQTRTVRICAKDRPGLFSRIAGTFTLNNLDILDAQVFTWRNGIAFDIFELNPPPDQIFEAERWDKTAAKLTMALEEHLDLGAALRTKLANYKTYRPGPTRRPHRVVVDNHSSSFFTIVEVFTYDFPGLLFSITDALFQSGLDIWVAKISTKIDQVVDVFYVRDYDGQKIDSEEKAFEIQAAIYSRLPELSRNA